MTTNIPNGWELAPQDKLQKVLESGIETSTLRFLDKHGRWADDGEWERARLVELSGEPTETHSTGVAVHVKQDGIRYAVNLSDSKVLQQIASNYFSHWKPLPGYEEDDICHYCGHSNGIDGEYRQGFDCYYCGGN